MILVTIRMGDIIDRLEAEAQFGVVCDGLDNSLGRWTSRYLNIEDREDRQFAVAVQDDV